MPRRSKVSSIRMSGMNRARSARAAASWSDGFNGIISVLIFGLKPFPQLHQQRVAVDIVMTPESLA